MWGFKEMWFVITSNNNVGMTWNIKIFHLENCCHNKLDLCVFSGLISKSRKKLKSFSATIRLQFSFESFDGI